MKIEFGPNYHERLDESINELKNENEIMLSLLRQVIEDVYLYDKEHPYMGLKGKLIYTGAKIENFLNQTAL